MDTSQNIPETTDPHPELALSSKAIGPRAERAARRTFTAEFKRRIVKEYDAAPKGSKGAGLRRERLYDSHVKEWRAAIDGATLEGPLRKGRPALSPDQARIRGLEKRATRLEAASAQKDQIIADRDAALEVLGKGVAFLEALSSKIPDEPVARTCSSSAGVSARGWRAGSRRAGRGGAGLLRWWR